ncbi:MAG: hypothetical protein IPN17_33195, partial [Deltaproteobacteria bacterium]|nr:hypothetical protein [Deltaproteobacteria bacterium]
TTPRARPSRCSGSESSTPASSKAPRGATSRARLRPARRFAAYLHAQRWNCVTATDPELLQAPHRAGIRIDAYQLEPLRKALLLPRVNLFIADDVGLGKTIEAGLILRELLMRQKVRRVVVAAPPSVVLQWRDELDARFGLPFVILDRDYVLAKRRERGYGVNPWTTHTRFMISHALLRDEAYAAPCATGSPTRAWARCSSSTRRTTPRPPAGLATPSTRASPAPCATSRRASSTGSSSRRRRTTATPTASPRSWRSSTRSASAAASRSRAPFASTAAVRQADDAAVAEPPAKVAPARPRRRGARERRRAGRAPRSAGAGRGRRGDRARQAAAGRRARHLALRARARPCSTRCPRSPRRTATRSDPRVSGSWRGCASTSSTARRWKTAAC